MTNSEYSESVRKNILQDFYTRRIEEHYIVSKEKGGVISISMTLFWHSIADFYGKLHLAGSEDKAFGNHSLKVERCYEHFIKEFFPSKWSCKASLLYEVFRCGMIHQISPKYAAIDYTDYEDLIYPIQDPNYPDDNSKTIPLLNSRVYGELVYVGFKEFERRVINNVEPKVIQSIHNRIISVHDGLKDQHNLSTQKALLGSDPYGPCV